jgi:DNA-binding IclR family transcriptional regulator
VSDDSRERDNQGRFVASISAEDLLDEMEPLEPYMTAEVAGALDIPRRTAYKYLDELADDGRVRKKKPEPRRVIWIRPG